MVAWRSRNAHLVIVRTPVGTRTNATKAPRVDQPIEAVVVAVLKEKRHYQAFKHAGLDYFPGSSVGHPANDILKLFLGQDRIEFDWELLNTN